MLFKAALLATSFFLTLATPSLAWTQHVTYCHFFEGKYVLVDVNVDQFNYQQNHTHDIIPPFDNSHGHFPGFNLTEDNKETLVNHCQPTKEDECEAPTVPQATQSAKLVVSDDQDKDTVCETPPAPQPTPPPPTPQPTSPPSVISPPSPQGPTTVSVLPDTADSSSPDLSLMVGVATLLSLGFVVRRAAKWVN